MMRRFLLALLFLVAPMQTHAADIPYALYAAGKYEEAAKAGVEAKTAWGFVVATRAALADATTRDKPCLPCLEKAIGYADRATALDPKMPDAHTFRAVALGHKARIVGMITSKLNNYPTKAQEDLLAALAVDPTNVWALGALGGWHIEIVRAGGSYLARLLYNADVETGLSLFSQAFKSAPDNLPVRFQYVLSLSGYDRDRFEKEISDTLALIPKMTPKTVYEKLAQDRAAQLAVVWKNGSRAEYARLIKKFQGYP